MHVSRCQEEIRLVVLTACLWQLFPVFGMDGIQSPGFFRGDLVMLNENDVRLNFERKLIIVLGVLPAKRHCAFLQSIAEHYSTSIQRVSDSISNFSRQISGTRFLLRRKCRLKAGRKESRKYVRNDNATSNSTVEKTFVFTQLVRLYNKLPLPFQCQILEEVGWKSAVNSRNKLQSEFRGWSEERISELGRIVQQSEEVLGRLHPLIRIGVQCARIVSGEDSYVSTVRFSCLTDLADAKSWLRLFRKQMARVYGKFAAENGIQIPKEVFLFVGSENFPYNAYHIEILNLTSVGRYRAVLFHIHLKKANSKALPANFIVSALHRYSKQDLARLFKSSNLSFTSVVDKRGKRPSRRYNNMKKLFPAYLSKYFSMLDAHEKCFILSMLSSYTNSSLSRIVQFLNRKRFQVQISCFPKRNDVSAKSNRENVIVSPQTTISPRTLSKSGLRNMHEIKFKQNLKKKEIYAPETNIAVTPVEISMFVVLGAVFIVGTMFVSICITYLKRKRRLKKATEVPPADGKLYEMGDNGSVDSVELDWIKRTRKIESDSGIFKEMRSIVVGSLVTHLSCPRCGGEGQGMDKYFVSCRQNMYYGHPRQDHVAGENYVSVPPCRCYTVDNCALDEQVRWRTLHDSEDTQASQVADYSEGHRSPRYFTDRGAQFASYSGHCIGYNCNGDHLQSAQLTEDGAEYNCSQGMTSPDVFLKSEDYDLLNSVRDRRRFSIDLPCHDTVFIASGRERMPSSRSDAPMTQKSDTYEKCSGRCLAHNVLYNSEHNLRRNYLRYHEDCTSSASAHTDSTSFSRKTEFSDHSGSKEGRGSNFEEFQERSLASYNPKYLYSKTESGPAIGEPYGSRVLRGARRTRDYIYRERMNRDPRGRTRSENIPTHVKDPGTSDGTTV